MPFKTEHDYETAHLLHLKGLNYKQIAEATGIPEPTLQKYGSRKQWSVNRQRMQDSLSGKVCRDATTFAEAYVLKAVSYGDKALDNVINRGFDMSLDDLGKLADVADKFDRITRRALKLDTDSQNSAGAKLAVQINVGSNQADSSIQVDSTADSQPADT